MGHQTYATIITIIAVMCTHCGAESVEASRIDCADSTYEFGTLTPSDTLEHTYTVANTGNAPLQIEGVQACCGANAQLETAQ